MGETPVTVEEHGPVRVVRLNRPEKLNAANLEMQRALLELWTAIAADEAVGAAVLTGNGRAFSAGGDLSLLRELAAGDRELQDELSRINREMLQTMLLMDVPVVAAVNGPAVGFGAALLALCDIVVIAATASISEPHVKHGLVASPACQLVWPHLTSRSVAKELLMSGRQVGAEEAVRIGLANRMVAAGEELGAALDIAHGLAALPRSGVVGVRRAFNRPLAEEARRDGGAPRAYDVVWPERAGPGTGS